MRSTYRGNPATLGQIAESGDRLTATCERRECLHAAALDVLALARRLGADVTVPELRQRLRCTACGGRAVSMTRSPHQAGRGIQGGGEFFTFRGDLPLCLTSIFYGGLACGCTQATAGAVARLERAAGGVTGAGGGATIAATVARRLSQSPPQSIASPARSSRSRTVASAGRPAGRGRHCRAAWSTCGRSTLTLVSGGAGSLEQPVESVAHISRQASVESRRIALDLQAIGGQAAGAGVGGVAVGAQGGELLGVLGGELGDRGLVRARGLLGLVPGLLGHLEPQAHQVGRANPPRHAAAGGGAEGGSDRRDDGEGADHGIRTVRFHGMRSRSHSAQAAPRPTARR